MTRLATLPRFYGVVLLIPILDLGVKAWASALVGGVRTLIPGVLAIRVVFNRGLVFGWGSGPGSSLQPLLLPVLALATVALFLMALRTPPTKTMRHSGFACMIGGALGNMLDRLLHGHVTDFVHVPLLPIFNLADVALWAGLAIVLSDISFSTNKQLD